MTIAVAQPAPTFHGVEEFDGNRYYLIDDLRLMSVTTANSVISKEAIIRWAARLAAKAAFTELPRVVISSRIKPCGNTYNRCSGPSGHGTTERCDRCPCGSCRECVADWLSGRHAEHSARRADEGRRTHDVIEWWSYHGEIKPYDEDIAPYVAAWQAFVTEYGLTPDDFLVSEAIVVNRTEEYAGTCDGIVVITASRTDAAAKLVARLTGVTPAKAKKLGLRVVLVIDIKTREKEEAQFYVTHALQCTAYRHAETIRIKGTDVEEPMIPTDGGLIVQLRPDGATPRLVKTDEDTYRRGFLPTLATARWVLEDGPAAISSRTFVLPATLAARRRKAAKEAAATGSATAVRATA